LAATGMPWAILPNLSFFLIFIDDFGDFSSAASLDSGILMLII